MRQLLPTNSNADSLGFYAPGQKRKFSPACYGSNAHTVKKTAGVRSLVSMLIALFFSVSAYASHYKGGQITYENMGGGTYKVTVKSYWRSQLPGSVIPSYSGSPTLNTSLNTVSLTPLPDGVTVEKVEQQTVTWPTPGLYSISWTSCCRVSGGANFTQTDMGLFAAVNYDPAHPSSSPQFYDLPVFNYAANVPLSFGFNNTDPENHDQEYTLNTPYGITTNPYSSMTSTGFSISSTGIVSWTNPQQGIWLVNVKLAEKINGVLTGAYVYRDFMLNIVPTTNTAPVLSNVVSQTVREGQTLNFNVNASDPNGNFATLQVSGLPMNMGASFVQNTTGSAPTGSFTWTPAVGTAGNYSLQLVATDNVTPPLSAQQTVAITVLPACNISATVSVTNMPCGNTNTGSLTVTASGGNAYEYSIDSAQTFQASNVFNNLMPGVYRVFVKENSCMSSMQTVTLNANPLPTVTLNPFGSYKTNDAPFQLSGGNPIGGTYSGTGVTNGNFDPAVAGVGTHAVTYTYSNAMGCSASVTQDIIVNAAPAVTFSPVSNVCIYTLPFCLTQGQPAGGTYSGRGVIRNVFWPILAGPGSHVITYTCKVKGVTTTAVQTITVSGIIRANAGPNQTIVNSGMANSCVTLSASATGGNGTFNYVWNTGATGATISVCPSKTTTYTVYVTDASGCVTGIDQVTVNVVSGISSHGKKVTLCHNGHEITVSSNAVQAHLAHGDYLGSCHTSSGSCHGNNNARVAQTTGEGSAQDVALTAIPNPFTDNTQIEFVMPETGSYALEIYDLKGTLVQRIAEGTANANERRSLEVNGSQWAKGVYMARLVTAKEVKVIKIVLTR